MSQEVVKEPLRVTCGFERKIQVRQYETAVASIHVQADVPLDADAKQIEEAIRNAFFQGKASVFEQLGIAFSIDENGVVMELIEKAFGPVEVVQDPQATAAPVQVGAPSGDPVCPQCGGPMWDNRAKKTNPKAPDYKCKNNECGGVIWPPKKR